MSCKTHFAQKVFIPLYQRRWGLHNPRLRSELAESQYRAEDEIRAEQWHRVCAIVDFAFTRNPYYRRRLTEAGYEPGALRGWRDFEALPPLAKDDIRRNSEGLISDGYSKDELFHKRTGGSTGLPLHLYWDHPARVEKAAIARRHDAWAGYEPGMKRAALWGDVEQNLPWRVRLHRALCEQTVYLDTLQMDERHLRRFVERLREFKPKVLMGHAHSIFFFAEYLIAHEIDTLGISSIISTAESLTPAERERIESHFGNVVFDRYGCEEVSMIASECEAHEGLHVASEGLYVEVIDASASVPGRVLVTDLTNRAMPFIRYEIGDLATLASGPCACARGLPRLSAIMGRTSEMLFAPDGRTISGISILDTFVIHISGIRQAQIIQDARDHIRLRLVRDQSFSDDTGRQLASAVTEIFGPEMRYDCEFVETIEPTPRGKYQVSICELRERGKLEN